MMSEGRFDGGNILVRDTNLVGKGAEDGFGLLEGGQSAGAEAFMLGLQLFEDVEPGALPRLLVEENVEFLACLRDFLMNLPQPLLAFLDGAAMTLRIALLRLDAGGK